MYRFISLLSAVFIALLGTVTGEARAQSMALIVAESERETWQAIGKLNANGPAETGGCTATLIAPDRVLTAAHCVVDQTKARIFPFYRINFRPGWHNGEGRPGAKVKSVRVHPDYLSALQDNPGGHNWATLASDLALIELDTPLTNVMPAKLAEGPIKPGPVAVLGYARRNPEELSDYVGCLGQPFRANVIALSCAVRSGVSGAPVMQQIDGAWQVVGVVSARGSEDTTPIEGFAVNAFRAELDRIFAR